METAEFFIPLEIKDRIIEPVDWFRSIETSQNATGEIRHHSTDKHEYQVKWNSKIFSKPSFFILWYYFFII